MAGFATDCLQLRSAQAEAATLAYRIARVARYRLPDEEVDDGDENYGADGGGCQAVEESAAAQDAEFGEDPAAEDGADQAEHDVGDAAVALRRGRFCRRASRRSGR